jgi:tetratricopeptide (TPR) repeat protein
MHCVTYVALGLLLAIATIMAGPALDSPAAGSTRLVVRVAWCLSLQLPWCAAALARVGPPAAPSVVGLLLAAAAAVGPPWVYAHRQSETWSRQAEAAIAELRLAEARPLLAALADVDGAAAVGGRPVADLIPAVDRQWRALTAAVARPLSAAAPPASRVERARALAVLGRFDDAAGLLTPLAGGDVAAELLLAAVRQRQGRYAESTVAYQAALDQLGDDRATAAARVRAYDGLAFNARAAGRPADAEAAYRDGLARVPAAAAHFHFQLGRHYEQAGRPGPALEHLREAVLLDPPTFAGPAGPVIERLTRSTPGCLLPRPGSER